MPGEIEPPERYKSLINDRWGAVWTNTPLHIRPEIMHLHPDRVIETLNKHLAPEGEEGIQNRSVYLLKLESAFYNLMLKLGYNPAEGTSDSHHLELYKINMGSKKLKTKKSEEHLTDEQAVKTLLKGGDYSFTREIIEIVDPLMPDILAKNREEIAKDPDEKLPYENYIKARKAMLKYLAGWKETIKKMNPGTHLT